MSSGESAVEAGARRLLRRKVPHLQILSVIVRETEKLRRCAGAARSLSRICARSRSEAVKQKFAPEQRTSKQDRRSDIAHHFFADFFGRPSAAWRVLKGEHSLLSADSYRDGDPSGKTAQPTRAPGDDLAVEDRSIRQAAKGGRKFWKRFGDFVGESASRGALRPG